METVSLEQAENLVTNVSFINWNGWNLVIDDDRYDGFYKVNGIFKNGKWITQYSFTINKEGKYVIPGRFKKFISSTGN